MRNTAISLITAGIFIASTAIAMAQTAPAPATATPPPAAAGTATTTTASLPATSALNPTAAGAPGYKTELVCHSMPPQTGSRLGARRVCLTQYEWDKQRLQAQSNTSDAELRDRMLQGN